MELQSSLRPGVWEGSEGLNSLYSHLMVQLVQANVKRDVTSPRTASTSSSGWPTRGGRRRPRPRVPRDTARSA